MANRRMFSADVVCTDKFVEMPSSTQALYLQFGMKADDDGFVSSPKQIVRMVGAAEDDLKILVAKGFIIPFESGVIVISDWKTNNSIRKDRYTQTRCLDELNKLENLNGKYVLSPTCQPSVNQLSTTCQPSGNHAVDVLETQVRLGKDSIDKSSINTTCPELEAPDRKKVISLSLNDNTEHWIYEDNVSKWSELFPAVDVMQELRKMKSWLDSNKARRKTKKGIARFINSWLSKEQDKGRMPVRSEPTHRNNNNFDRREYDMDSLEEQLLNSN